MNLFFHIVYLLINVLLNNQAKAIDGFKPKKFTIIFDKLMTPCPGKENTTIQYTLLKYVNNKQNGDILFDYDIDIAKDLNEKSKIAINIERCKSKEALDTCVKFSNFNTDKLCQMLEQSNEVWSPMTKCIIPPWKCPLHKGKYRGRNCSFDADAFNWFPLEGAYWKFRVQYILQSKEVASCILVEGLPKPIRIQE